MTQENKKVKERNSENLKELRTKVQRMIRDFTKKVNTTADEYGVKLDVAVRIQEKSH
jgi:hypothetical protein